jgi:hypothetical protein
MLGGNRVERDTVERDVVKLSVNLPRDVVDALREIAAEKGTTVTEALRRSVSTQKFVEDSVKGGSKILVEDPKSKTVREVVFR